jgi:hypothetical protein
MIGSQIVQIDGSFVGAAMPHDDGYRFVALDVLLDDLDGRTWPTFVALHSDVRWAFQQSRAHRRAADVVWAWALDDER